MWWIQLLPVIRSNVHQKDKNPLRLLTIRLLAVPF